MQRALIQYRLPENYDLVKEALLKAGRKDLIGFDEKCLIPPRKMRYEDRKNERKNAGRKTDMGYAKRKRKHRPENRKKG